MEEILRRTDRMIWRAVKNMLLLPTHIIDECLYTSMRLGGLGVFSFSRKIPIIMRDRLNNTRSKCDLFCQIITTDDPIIFKIRKMIKPDLTTKVAIEQHNADKLEGSFYGGSTKQASNNSASNFYIRTPMVWTGRLKERVKRKRYNMNVRIILERVKREGTI